MMPKYKLSIEQRFKDKYDVLESGCWKWKGAFRNDGYGTLKVDGKNVGAHRFSYKLNRGEFDETLCVLHTCDNRYCVNPNHLFLGTKADNAQDKLSKDRLGSMHGTEDERVAVCNCMECRSFRGESNSKAVHPSISHYARGCRCAGCKEARRVYLREYRNRDKRDA